MKGSTSATPPAEPFLGSPYPSPPGVKWVTRDTAVVSASRITCAELKQYLEVNYTDRYVVQVCLPEIHRTPPWPRPNTPRAGANMATLLQLRRDLFKITIGPTRG